MRQYEIAYSFHTGVAEMQCDRRRGPEKSAAVISKISRDPAVAAEASGAHCDYDCDLGGASEGEATEAEWAASEPAGGKPSPV